MTGTIQATLNKGFGFIAVPGREKNIFFHASEMTAGSFDNLQRGQEVEFDLGDSDRGPVAVNVRPIN